MTRIAVALCAYNGARYLGRQLQSILDQQRLPDEMVILDDASSDATPDMLRDFAARAPFEVRLHVNEHNLGVTPNFERALAACRGDIIALADQDDEWLPHKLLLCEQEMARHPHWGMAFSDAEVIGDLSEPLGFGLWEALAFDAGQRDCFSFGRAWDVLERRNVVTGAVSVMTSSLLRQCLPISPRWVHDAWIAAVASVVSQIGLIPERLMRYRRHSRQQVGVRQPGTAALSARQRVSRWLSTRDEALGRSSAKLADLLAHLDHVVPARQASPAVSAYRERYEHLNLRLSLPRSPLRRLLTVGQELASRRYTRFSSGSSSALKDFVLPPGRAEAEGSPVSANAGSVRRQ